MRQSTPNNHLPRRSGVSSREGNLGTTGADGVPSSFPAGISFASALDVEFSTIIDHWPLPLQAEPATSSPEKILEDELSKSILECIAPHLWQPRYLQKAQVKAIVKILCSFIPTLATTGHCLYIHRMLYKDWQPPDYQDSCSLAALYMMKTQQNSSILINTINNKILDLIKHSESWTLIEHLAAVQALLIYQIMRLFDADLKQQDLAYKQNALLELWTALLWKRSFKEPPYYPSPFETWVFQESLRRTVLMSVFVRGAWTCVTMNGLCDQVPLLARLPLTKDIKLWEMGPEEWSERTGALDNGAGLIAYGDLSYAWSPDRSLEQLSEFERLLLVACKAGEDGGSMEEGRV